MELLIAFTALLLAITIGLLSKRRVVIEVASVGARLVMCTVAIIIALRVAENGIYAPMQFFFIDSLSAIIILIIAVVGLGATLYSIQYLRHETAKHIIGFHRVREYFILMNLFTTAMLLAISSSSPIVTWICVEATTLSTAFLISFYNKPSAMEAAWKYLIVNSVGLLLGFFGTLLYFTSMNNVAGGDISTWQTLTAHADQLDPMIAKIAFIFVLIGYGTKVGFVPMHTWKPDAYSKAPAPLGALLSGALLPVAFTLVLKFRMITDIAVGPIFSQRLLIIFGLLSIAVSALIMFAVKNYKRLLAYSSIEHAGLMALGFGFGGLGGFAALLHMVYHSCIKATMFFLSGNILLKFNSSKIKNVTGALSIIPVTSVLFILGFLVVTGIPPFGIFFTKIMILSAGMQTHPVITVIALIFLTIVFINFFKQVVAMCFGTPDPKLSIGEPSHWLIIPPLVFLILVVILTIYIPPFLATLLANAAAVY